MPKTIDIDKDFSIHCAKFEDMPFFLSMAEKIGWNPGLDDALPFYSADPEGFFYGEYKGKKIGCVSAVRYSENYGFLGFYIMSPEYRKLGYGYHLGLRASAQFKNQCLGLDAQPLQQASFEALGFKLYFKNIQYCVTGGGAAPEGLTPLKEIDLTTLTDYDKPIFGAERNEFLKHWTVMPSSYGYGFLEEGQLKGYGVIRRCIKGWRIGPLFADHQDAAKTLFQGLLSHAPDAPVYLHVPEINQSAVNIVKQHQMEEVSSTLRMYTEAPPSQEFAKMYGITTIELG